MKKLLIWFLSLLGKNSWLTHDKFCHCMLHLWIVRKLRTSGVVWHRAIIYSALFGIGYELVFDIAIPLLRKKKVDWKDSLRDIVWNTIGGFTGLSC